MALKNLDASLVLVGYESFNDMPVMMFRGTRMIILHFGAFLICRTQSWLAPAPRQGNKYSLRSIVARLRAAVKQGGHQEIQPSGLPQDNT